MEDTVEIVLCCGNLGILVKKLLCETMKIYRNLNEMQRNYE